MDSRLLFGVSGLVLIRNNIFIMRNILFPMESMQIQTSFGTLRYRIPAKRYNKREKRGR